MHKPTPGILVFQVTCGDAIWKIECEKIFCMKVFLNYIINQDSFISKKEIKKDSILIKEKLFFGLRKFLFLNRYSKLRIIFVKK